MKNTVTTLQEQKNKGEKITMITCYDYSSAKIVEEAGINTILVTGGGTIPPVNPCIVTAIVLITAAVVFFPELQKLAYPDTKFNAYLIPYIVEYAAFTFSLFVPPYKIYSTSA